MEMWRYGVLLHKNRNLTADEWLAGRRSGQLVVCCAALQCVVAALCAAGELRGRLTGWPSEWREIRIGHGWNGWISKSGRLEAHRPP